MTDTISLAEAAYLLQAGLGSLRQWVAFLNDINRGKETNVHGLVLLPCAYLHDGHQWRPRYALIEAYEFINGVQTFEPKARRTKVEPVPLMIRKGSNGKLNRFDKDGKPVTKIMRPAPTMSHTGTAMTMH